MLFTLTLKTRSHSSSVTSAVGYSNNHISVRPSSVCIRTHLIPITSSSIVHQYIDTPEFGDGKIQNRIPVCFLGNVHALEDQVARVLRGDILAALDIDIGDDDFRAFFAEASYDCCSEA